MKKLLALAVALVAISPATAARAADALPACAPEQQAVDSMASNPTSPGSAAKVAIYAGAGPEDANTVSPDNFTVTVNGGAERSIPSWQESFTFKMPDTDATVELTAQPVTLDPTPGSYAMVPVCAQTVTLVVHVKPLLTPSFVPTIERSYDSAYDAIPRLRFALKHACQRVEKQVTTWSMRFVGEKKASTVRQADPCKKPFTLRPAFAPLVQFAREQHIPAAQVDFVINGSTHGWHKSWRFRMTYAHTAGRDIEDTDFDNYVNICINGSHEIYASGGHLWCSIAPTQSYGLRVV